MILLKIAVNPKLTFFVTKIHLTIIPGSDFNSFNFSGYDDDDVGSNDVCAGKPSASQALGQTQSIPGGPLICMNDDGAIVLSGIASRNSKSIAKNSPGIFTNIYNLR